jgi:hypothetical protein
MIHSYRSEAEAVHGTSLQPDLSAEEALNALDDLVKLMLRFSDGSFRAVINIFSFIVRLGRMPIRRHEDTVLRSIHDRVLLKHEPVDYDSPYFKIFLLLQTNFSRLPLSPELAADLSIVLEHIFFLFSVCAHRDWSNLGSRWAVSPFQILSLMRMCVHGMWQYDPELKQIPHFEYDVSCSITRQGLELIQASRYRPFPCSRHRVRAWHCKHGCASTQRPPDDGR